MNYDICGNSWFEFCWIYMVRLKILMKNWLDGFVRIFNDLVYKYKIVYVGRKVRIGVKFLCLYLVWNIFFVK